nr:BTAD domain-containing putative transcriptional regulator [Planomonospora venezuelensis]
MGVNVLGPMTAEIDGQAVALGGPKQRAVLALLVAARGEAVTAEGIIAGIWGESDISLMSTLHAYIAKIRRAIEPARAAKARSGLLVRAGAGYAFRMDAAAVDAERFGRLAEEGARLLERGGAAEAVAVLTGALELWRGRPYAEFADMPFAAPEAARLEGLHRTARENLFGAQLAVGRHAEIVGDLEKHVAEQPLSERGWELLVLALYRSGRQGDALATLRSARKMLVEELGVDPGPALRELESAVLAQDEALRPRPAAPAGPAGNVPYALSGLVGRDTDIRRVNALLAANRLVTLTGPGGIGKTRLALEAARARRDGDGPWLVELGGLTDGTLLAGTVAQVLGVSGAASTERVAQALRDRRLLLVLDNCEHLVDAVRETAAELLARTAGLRILATSRETLGLPGEVVYEVPALPGGQAQELFLGRAAAAAPGWDPTRQEQEAVRELCDELDGLPLAIELAAAQCRMLSVEQIRDALEDRFALLAAGPGVQQRHSTLLRTVEWSHRLLEPAERELFHRLGAFAAGFDLDAAEAVCGGPVLEGLGALVRKSLVAVEAGTSPRRYRLLETLKEFARTRQDPAELARAQAAHRAWVLARAEAAGSRLRGDKAVPAMRLLITDQPEHRAAFTSALLAGDGEYAMRLGAALSWFWYRRGHVAEGLRRLATAMELTHDPAPGVRAGALLGVAGLCYLAGDFPAARLAARDAADAARTAGDLHAEGHALTYQALFGGLCGIPTAVADIRAALDLSRQAEAGWLEAEALMGLGMLLLGAGEVNEARQALEEANAVGAANGHRFVQGSATWLLMKTDLRTGRAEQALGPGGEILLLLEDEGDITSWLVIAQTLAAALSMTGHPREGAELLGAVQAVGTRVGFSPLEMDPADAGWQAEQVRRALPAADLADRLAKGGRMSTAEVRAMLTCLAHDYAR